MSKLAALMVAATISVLDAQPKPMHIEATAYCYGTTTATGKNVREGYAAMAPEYIGKTAVVYTEDMEFVGIYEIEDTGSDNRIKNGTCIDIYNQSYDWCIKFGRKKVNVFIYDAVG